MQSDLHTHTIASGHGTSCTIADMAKMAYSRGVKLLGITDHGPATPASGTPSYFRSLTMAPHYRCGIHILYGAELNILNTAGNVDLDDEILSHLDYAIISMHTQTYTSGTSEENTLAYIQAMSHPNVKIIGHCDDVKFPVNYETLVSAAQDHGVLLELNEVSLSPDGYRGNTRDNDIQLLKWCRIYDHPVIFSSDSHGPQGIGYFPFCQSLVQEVGFPSRLILNNDPQKLLTFLAPSV